jgi:trehalose 6-phosphate phosphatase
LASEDVRGEGFAHVRPAAAGDALALVRPWLDRRLLLASDFDGTLARLAMDPWGTGIVDLAQRALRRLSAQPGTHVAFISGRTVPDLARRVRVGGAEYLGDHGAQSAVAPRGFRPAALRYRSEPVDPAARAMAERLRDEVPRRIDEPWLVVEDKGSAVTFHFRAAPDIDAARARVRAAVDAIDPSGVLDQPGGRRAWELRPPGAMTKGRALAALIERHRPGLVLMLGDDRHDAEAFDIVRTARASSRLAGLAVAVVSPAGDPAEMADRADLQFADADVTARFLAGLARERARRTAFRTTPDAEG